MTDRQTYSCQGCDRDDLTLTKNGRVRSHAPNGKRVGPDNPACPEGSNFPVQDTEFHTHRFEYGDDEIHMAGSFCTVDDCDMAEPADKPEEIRLPAPPPRPNPFRDPLPGGLHDNAAPATHTGRPAMHSSAPSRPQPPAPVSADEFLDSADYDDYAEPADDGGPSYWPARYDGECTTCFSHFDAGDNIRKIGPREYEAQDCCGYGATPKPEVPKSVARTLPVVRGRYVLPDPETGKPVKASRASKYAEGIADSYALDQWRHRMILVGLVKDPEILDKVQSGIRDQDPLDAVKTRRAFLNERAEEAMSAAGGDIRSGKGTTSHKYTEEVDAGTRALIDVPKEYRKDVAAYRLALSSCGFEPVKGLIERSVYSAELGVCGTFDRVLRCIRTTDALDLNGRMITIHEGEFVIGDVKTGDNIEHPWLEILVQEAVYAHAVNENGVAVQDDSGGPFRWAPLSEFGVDKVREDVGVVMHVPYGQGECHFYAADLITGWRGALLCKGNRDFWKIKLPKVPIVTYTVAPDDPVDHPQDVLDRRSAREQAEGRPVDADGQPLQIECDCGQTWPDVKSMQDAGHSPQGCVEAMVEEVYGQQEKEPVADPPKISALVNSKSRVIEQTHAEIEQRFRDARTRAEANAAWADAKRFGIPPEEIKRLISLVRLEDPASADQHDPKPQTAVSRPESRSGDKPVAEEGGSRPPAAQPQAQPNLTERAHRVTTKAEASKIFQEANEKISEMPEEKRPAAREYRDKLVKIMKDRLASSPA